MPASRRRIARARALRQAIHQHDHEYYVEDAPCISDGAYDELFRELKAIEEAHPELITPDSPTQRVSGAVLESLETVEHLAPMLSLDSDETREALERFDRRVREALDRDVDYVLDPKFDGASLELVYEDGLLARAATRGDGARGERITDNVRTIAAVPLRLRGDKRRVPSTVALRGEVIMRTEAFEKLNERLVADGREPFANPRNSAAGALRQLDSRATSRRPLDIFVYDVLFADSLEVATQWEVIEVLRDWGLKVNDLPRRVGSVEEIVEYHRRLQETRDDLGYEIDGVVIKLDDLAARAELGETSHHPRWAFALKFPARKEVTRVEKIVPSVGRTGVVTPVALMLPVEIGGVTVARATLHNREEVARKDIREGDRVRIQRAGDVIPQVLERLGERGRKRKGKFTMPTSCPSCGTRLVERGPFSVCTNAFECPAQLAGRIIHFGSRQALDISGLGGETARLLVREGLVAQLADLYRLRPEQLVDLEGFAEKSAVALVAGIGASSPAELARFLYGLGIPEVGVTVARLLAATFGTLAAVRNASDDRLQRIDGIGPRMAEQIRSFFDNEHNARALDLLLGRMIVSEAEISVTGDALAGVKFVFTGGLSSMSRAEAKELVETAGGKVSTAVSKATGFVVAGDNPGSKLARATDLGVQVLDEEAFRRLLRERGVAD